MKTSLNLIAAIACLIVAVTFIFIVPNSGIETAIVGTLSILFSAFGINWRTQYTEVKAWLKSKTIVGALIVAIPAIILLVVPIFFDLSKIMIFGQSLQEILLYILAAGGGTFLIGAANAKSKKDKENNNVG